VIEKVAWSDVGMVKIQIIEYRKPNSSIAVTEDRNFLLLDRSGHIAHEVKVGSKTCPRKD
jgi:hypothetical protein